MLQAYDRLHVGGETSCRSGVDNLAVVHACKSPCHQAAVGYKGSLPSQHPHYLVLRRDRDLFLNIIDPPVPLFGPETFSAFLAFAGEHYDQGRSLLIHCNQGESKAPSLALLFLAKYLRVIPGDSYVEARIAFTVMYPGYRPGSGIQRFLDQNWQSF